MCALVTQGCYPAIIVTVCSVYAVIVAMQVHTANLEVAGVVGSSSGPNGVIALRNFIMLHPGNRNIIGFQVLGFQVQFADVAAQK